MEHVPGNTCLPIPHLLALHAQKPKWIYDFISCIYGTWTGPIKAHACTDLCSLVYAYLLQYFDVQSFAAFDTDEDRKTCSHLMLKLVPFFSSKHSRMCFDLNLSLIHI